MCEEWSHQYEYVNMYDIALGDSVTQVLGDIVTGWCRVWWGSA